MTFPVHIPLFGHPVHPHLLMELIAYPIGFHLWLYLRRRSTAMHIPAEKGLWLVAGAILGGAIGAKLLAWVEDWPRYWEHAGDWSTWIGGKTLVGGLLGGWAGVEVAKKGVGIRGSTGDAYVLPLIVGMSIGRVGCFLTGLADKTYGVPTTLPWGVDFGDGFARHPTQLYEVAFLLTLGVAGCLEPFSRQKGFQTPLPGRRFRLFMLAYLAFRFCVEFIKPVYAPYLGLSAIQVVCVIGMLLCLRGLRRGVHDSTFQSSNLEKHPFAKPETLNLEP